jgi:hypothetical protein
MRLSMSGAAPLRHRAGGQVANVAASIDFQTPAPAPTHLED